MGYSQRRKTLTRKLIAKRQIQKVYLQQITNSLVSCGLESKLKGSCNNNLMPHDTYLSAYFTKESKRLTSQKSSVNYQSRSSGTAKEEERIMQYNSNLSGLWKTAPSTKTITKKELRSIASKMNISYVHFIEKAKQSGILLHE